MLYNDMADAPLTGVPAEAAAQEGPQRPGRIRTARNAQGNEVPVDEAEAERGEGGRTDAQAMEARQIEAQQIGAQQPESAAAEAQGPGLIQASQFALLDEIFASAGTLSLGAALRGVKEGLEQAAALVTAEGVARGAGTIAPGDGGAPAVTQSQPEAEPASAQTPPAMVLTLPPEAVKMLAEMKHNRALDFTYQNVDRGEVLGTGAQHGIPSRPEVSRSAGAMLG